MVTTPITLDGVLYPVTTNLHSALCHLRDEKLARRVRVNAICINQKDFEERSREVARMTEIYKSADYVIAWVGDRADYNEKDIEALFERAETVAGMIEKGD